MPKAVLTTKVDPSYDDLPEHRYHFPRTYLRAAQAALGDWILYYEPHCVSADLSSSGGRQSYFATARIASIGSDPNRAGHYYAYVEDYLVFDRAVPFRDDGFYYESRLQKADGSTNKGMFGRSVRLRPRWSLPISSRMKGNFWIVEMMIFLPCVMNRRRSPDRSACPTVDFTWAYCRIVSRICWSRMRRSVTTMIESKTDAPLLSSGIS